MNIAAMMGELNDGGGNDYSASCGTLYVDEEKTLPEEKEEIVEMVKKIIYLRSNEQKSKNGK